MQIPIFELNNKQHTESSWHQLCIDRNIPMIKVVRRARYGDVHWDYITMHPDLDKLFKLEEEWIVTELSELLKYYADAKTDGYIGSFTGKVKNIPIESVGDYAQDVSNTLSAAYQRYIKQNA